MINAEPVSVDRLIFRKTCDLHYKREGLAAALSGIDNSLFHGYILSDVLCVGIGYQYVLALVSGLLSRSERALLQRYKVVALMDFSELIAVGNAVCRGVITACLGNAVACACGYVLYGNALPVR